MDKFKAYLKAKGLTDEQITAIVDGMKAEKIYLSSEENIDERYTKLKGQHADLEGQLATANTTIGDLKKANKDNETLQATITQHETTIETLKKDSAAKIRNITLDGAIKGALSGADEKYHGLLVKALDKDKIVVNEDGTIVGLDEQVKTVKETYSDLFKPVVKGKEPNNKSTGTPAEKNPWSKEHFNLTEQGKILKEDPELAKQLKASV